jgi:hypothetical protein
MTHPASTDEFDYTRAVLRTDSTHGPLSVQRLDVDNIDHYALYRGEPEAVLACVAGIWVQLAVPTPAVDAMAGVLEALLRQLSAGSAGTLYEADDEDLTAFVTAGADGATAERSATDMRLRRNAINATYLALEDAGVLDRVPVFRVAALKGDTRVDRRGKHRHNALATRTRNTYEERDHVRAATHDEVLLVRLASRLVGTRRTQHLSAVCVAVCTHTATTSEAPQVLWQHYTGNQLHLPGRTTAEPTPETDIAARIVDLDQWGSATLAAWQDENSRTRPPHPEDSMLYKGAQELTSNSATVCVDKQVRNAMARAGLDTTRGLTAGSLRLWAATKDVTTVGDAAAGAARAGVRLTTLHRLIHRLGERAI